MRDLVTRRAWLFAILTLIVAEFADGLSGRPTYAQEKTSGTIQFSAATARLTIGDLPANAETSVALPYNWDKRHPNFSGMGRFSLTLPAGVQIGTDSALFFARVGNRFQLFVNGTLIADEQRDFAPNDDLVKLPRLVPIPPGLLQGNDRIEVVIWCDLLRRGGLSVIRFGPLASLSAEHRSEYAWRAGGSLVVASISAALGVMGFLLWFAKPSWLYLVYGAAELLWVVRVSDIFIESPPISWPVWGSIVALASAWSIGLFGSVVLRIAKFHSRPVGVAIGIYLVLSIPISLLAFSPGLRWLWTSWIGVMVFMGVASLVAAVRAALDSRSTEHTLLAVAMIVAVLAGLYDWTSIWLTGERFGARSLSRYVTVLLGLALAWIFANRYGQAILEIRDLNRDLERRVAKREEELAVAFEAARITSQEAAALAERNRLMRDMHDGVGSLLSAALRAIDRGETSGKSTRGLIVEALEELKLTVDSLQPHNDDLATVLGSTRFRLNDRLSAAGVECSWDVPILPPIQDLSPAAVRNIQHLILESFTNAISHGGARHIRLRAFETESPRPAVVIEITDDGCGFDTRSVSGGRGLLNMGERARDLGGALDIRSALGQGCQVQISLYKDVAHIRSADSIRATD